MANDAASRLIDQLIKDPELRTRFRSDPEATMREAGLAEAERQALAGTDWSKVPDQELAQRVSKAKRFF